MRVSVGLPVYNEERYLARTLDDLLSQSFRDFEVVIVDNASSDGTAAIAAEYASRDARVRYHRNTSNIGMFANFNRAFELSSGEYFMWGGGHDRWPPDYLEKLVAAMDADPGIALAYPRVEWRTKAGEPLPTPHSRLDSRAQGLTARFNIALWMDRAEFIYGLIRSDMLRKTGLFQAILPPENLIIAELSLYGSIAYVPGTTLQLERHEEEWVGNVWEMFIRSGLRRFFPADRPRRLWFPTWGYWLASLAAVGRAEIPLRRKPVLWLCACLAVFARRGKNMVHELFLCPKIAVGRT